MALTKPRAYQIYDIDYKQATRAVTVANVTLGGGAPAVVDGVNLIARDRVLVTGQSDAKQNGIYAVSVVGSGSDGTWIRSDDTNSSGELLAGTIVMVTEGTGYADTQWKLITDNPIIIGTTLLIFTQNYSANSISAGTSNVSVQSNANVTISSSGTANVLTVSNTGVYVSGVVSATGNVTGNYVIGNGSQLTGLPAGYSNADVSTYLASGTNSANIVTTGNVSGNYVLGNGSQLTGLPAGYSNADVATYLASNANVVITTTGNITTTANISGNYILGNGSQLTGLPAGYANSNAASYFASGNVTTNILTTALISASGNVTGGNVTADGTIAVGGIKLSGNLIVGDGPTLTIDPNGSGGTDGNVVITGNLTVQGTTTTINSNTITTNDLQINMANNAANATAANNGGIGIGPVGAEYATLLYNTAANVWVASLGISSVGNISANNLSANTVTGTLSTAAQTNITSVGTLTSLNSGTISSSGNVTGANILTSGLISATGNVTGNYFIGNGSALTGITVAGQLTWTTQANTAPSGINPGSFWYDSYSGVKYQYTNDGTGNFWVDQSFPTSFSTLAVTGNATIGGDLAVTGAISYGNITSPGYISAVGNVTGGNLRTAGLVTAAGNITGGNISTAGLITITGNATAGNIQTAGVMSATGNITGGNIQTAGLVSSTGNITAGNISVGTGTVALGNIVNANGNGVGNIGSSSLYFNTVFAKATSAQYADLAEMYVANQDLIPGTVVEFGGEHEIRASQSSHSTTVAGIVSTNPSYLMNAAQAGDYTVPVALTGRVPCQVTGTIHKGDRLVASNTVGVATVLDMTRYEPGCIIGKALDDYNSNNIGVIEVAVGRT